MNIGVLTENTFSFRSNIIFFGDLQVLTVSIIQKKVLLN